MFFFQKLEDINRDIVIRGQTISTKLLTLNSNVDEDTLIPCSIAGLDTKMIIDSGAGVNTVTKEVFDRINESTELRERLYNVTKTSDKRLVAYASNKEIKVEGTFVTDLKIPGRQTGFEKFYVIKGASQSLLSKKTALRYRVLQIGLNVPVTTEDKETNLDKCALFQCTESAEAFPKFNVKPVKIDIDKSVKPQRSTYNNIEFAWRELTEKRLQEMLYNDIIEEVTEEMDMTYCSPLMAVPKGKDDFRLVVDLRGPNKAVIREPHLMPTMDEILTKLKGAVLFSTIDLSSAFFHVELDSTSRHITTFYSGRKFYRYKRLPFGLCNAPDIFQKTMENILEGCEGIVIYLDDILIYGNSPEDHARNLSAVQKKLKEHNVKLNLKKCIFEQEEVTFLGFRFTSRGYRVTKERLAGIENFRKPVNVAEVKSFMGLINFVDRFIINRAEKTKTLQNMISNQEFVWSKEAEDEFEFMRREALQIVKNLGYFCIKDSVELIVDASSVGLGAVLTQRNDKGEPRIISCASKRLSPTERRYPQTQLESLAVVWAVERFRFYLFGRDFKIFTDSEANEFIFNNQQKLTKRVITRAESWALRLQPYRFTIERVASTENIADVFSRLIKETQSDDPFDETCEYHNLFMTDELTRPLTWEDIARATETDEELCKVIEFIVNKDWPKDEAENLRHFKNSLFMMGGVVIFKDRYVCPTALREIALTKAHEGHFGASSMKRLLGQYMWWPGLNREIERMVAKCVICTRVSLVPKPLPIKSRRLPDGPMENVQIDFLYVPGCGSQELLVMADTFSRMCWAIEVKKTDTESTIKSLEAIFNIWGRPKQIQSDNGPPFNSSRFSQHWKEVGVRHDLSVPYCPFMNGVVERHNRDIIRSLQIAQIEEGDWRKQLNHAVNKYNHEIPHSTTGFTPFELITGRKFNGFFPSLSELRGGTKTICYDDLRIRDANMKRKSARNTDRVRSATENNVEMGDWVLVTNKNLSNKLASRYMADYYMVLHREGARLFLRNSNGKEMSRWAADVRKVPEGTPVPCYDENFAQKPNDDESSQNILPTKNTTNDDAIMSEDACTEEAERDGDDKGGECSNEQEKTPRKSRKREAPARYKDYHMFNIYC